MASLKTKSNGASILAKNLQEPYPNRTITPAVKFSFDQHTARSVTSPSAKEKKKMTCMCSPTTHPGSFRCSFHKKLSNMNDNRSNNAASYRTHRLYTRRSALTNSLVRIGTVEGYLMKRALASLIRPASHQQKRRGEFQPKPSRLSVMSKAGD